MSDVIYETMPKKLRIGYSSYVVKVMDKDAAELVGVCGTSHAIKQVITITEDMVPQQVANTFLHEVIHAIHHMAGLMGRENPSEEEYTNLTANGLCAFFQDNPEALDWMQMALATEATEE